MSRKEKLILKLEDPALDKNWTLPETIKLLSLFGWKETGGKSSHRVFTRPGAPHAITLAPHGSQIKPGYIRMIRSILIP